MLEMYTEWAGWTVSAGALLVLAAGMASLIPQLGWLMDLVSHFRAQLGWLNLGAAILALLGHQPWLAFANTLCSFTIFATLVPMVRRRVKGTDSETKLVLFNVRMRNRAYDRTLDYALREAPDLLGLVEVDQGWIDAMTPLHELFAHRAIIPHPSSYGLALYSQHPIQSWRPAKVKGSDTDHLEATVELPEGPLNIILAHLPPPFTPGEMEKRDQRLARLGDVAASLDGPTLLMGDFNASPWTPSIRSVEKSSKLSSFRLGRGLFPTWPAMFWPGRVPIDQILGSTGTVAFSRAVVGPDLGSDHLPVVVGLALKPGSAQG